MLLTPCFLPMVAAFYLSVVLPKTDYLFKKSEAACMHNGDQMQKVQVGTTKYHWKIDHLKMICL